MALRKRRKRGRGREPKVVTQPLPKSKRRDRIRAPSGGAQGMVDFAAPLYLTVQAACSCGGENPNCFKCSGTGYYDKKIAPGAAPAVVSPLVTNTPPVAGFASDFRGNAYGIREKGRFDSRPDHDDYSDEGQA